MLKIVKTENGLVKGHAGNNTRVTVFKGIPFAAPPIGMNRWKAPQPCQDWDGIKEAYSFAPISIQDTPGLGTDLCTKEWHTDPDIEMSEDCLYLNIWTPAHTANEKLPVMVWFFGGAYQWGYTSEMEFNGENTAKRGVIVVSVNYRLAAMGFLAHPDLTKESPDAPANFGLLDQRAGLDWVIRNIENFGGDPSNITIAGQSAGGASVLSHLTSPKSIGMYQRAIIYSGMIRNPYYVDSLITPGPICDMEELGKEFLAFLGVDTIDEARLLDALFIRDKYGEFAQSHRRFVPTIDGQFILDDPYKLFMAGKHAHVPMISGNTIDEFLISMPEDEHSAWAQRTVQKFGDKAYEPLRAIECSVKAGFYANSAPSYYYSFEATIPGEDHPGCFHSVDLWFFFETLAASPRPFNGLHYRLARYMCNYITNFVKNGDPNGMDANGTELVTWHPYSSDSKNEMHFAESGCKCTVNNDAFYDYMIDRIIALNSGNGKKQAVNPYLPSWEYIPDGEPYVFDDRVYVYGSHDIFNGHAFCLDDYVCWSAPVDDLGNWRYEGVIYKRTQDPKNAKNNMCLYAPDVTVGPDGRYYLYYVLDKISIVSVAVCDTPAGKYEFLGYVHYEDGTLLGENEGDEPQFDPGVITIGKTTYLYTGFCGHGDTSRHGAMVTVLDSDMLTVIREPKIIVPGGCYSDGTEFEGHGFFEAPSIRTFDGKFYFIYSSQVMHELCYAISNSPVGPFTYGGVIISNNDIGIGTYKDASRPAAFGGNNHGSLIEFNKKRYIFYHRHTNNTWYSRQGCAEEVHFFADGSGLISQAEMTSCGLNNGPLSDLYTIPAYTVCNMMCTDEKRKSALYVGDYDLPYVTQEGCDAYFTSDSYTSKRVVQHHTAYITKITDGCVFGYKYINCKDIKGISLKIRGYSNGSFIIRAASAGSTSAVGSSLAYDNPVLARIPMEYSTVWETYSAPCNIPDGINAIYITFEGDGSAELLEFEFLH